MQENCYLHRLGCRKSSDGHSESAPANSASIDNAAVFAYADIPVDIWKWPPAVTSITENRDGPLTVTRSVARSSDCVAFTSRQPAAPMDIPIVSLTSHDKLWGPAGGPMTTHTHAPHAAWKNERSLGLIPPDRSQVPSGPTDLDVFVPSWSQCGDDRHAVGAPAVQPSLPRYIQQPVPAWPYMAALPETIASSIGRAHIAGLGAVGPCVADPVQWQAPSPSNRRRPRGVPHARMEDVICERCRKKMRRQSLKRHVREVHDHIKRAHPQSGLATQAVP